MITGAQIRMARGYARLSIKGLADISGVAESTIKRMELAEGVPSSAGTNLNKVMKALHELGIQFLDSGEVAAGPGVAVRNKSE